MSIEQTQKDIYSRLRSNKSGFGERLKLIRGKRSRETFAQLMEVSSSAINNYENETRLPSIDFLRVLYLRESVLPNWIVLGWGKPYDTAAPLEEVIPAIYSEKTLVESVLEEMAIELTDTQKNALVAIVKEDIRKKIAAIAGAIAG